jgi:hypothetical protein
LPDLYFGIYKIERDPRVAFELTIGINCQRREIEWPRIALLQDGKLADMVVDWQFLN